MDACRPVLTFCCTAQEQQDLKSASVHVRDVTVGQRATIFTLSPCRQSRLPEMSMYDGASCRTCIVNARNARTGENVDYVEADEGAEYMPVPDDYVVDSALSWLTGDSTQTLHQ